ncbi:MAG: iron donor protein CyaY [Spongiibacteraceae bacterium]|nr:iron donor protein CyaY [Spongiibacteraceae bacterium]
MNEATFNDLIDETMANIEDAVDNSDSDIDCENAGGILTLTCEDGSAIIFSRQLATQELWIAARSGGFHLRYEDERWYCQKYQQSLVQLFASITEQQAGEALAFE